MDSHSRCLHVPALSNLLYSLHAHQCQYGCGFLGMHNLGIFVYFPMLIMEVDTATDCHLLYELIGHSGTLPSLDYVQPRSVVSSALTTQSLPSAPVVIEGDHNDKDIPLTYTGHWPKQPPLPLPLIYDLSLIPPLAFLVSLKDLMRDELISQLYLVEMRASHLKMAIKPDESQSAPEPDGSHSAPAKLECMSEGNILVRLHHPGSRPPPVGPCNMPNASENKTADSPKELHHLARCCHSPNYHHIILSSKNDTLLNSGEFPLSLGSYAAILNAPCSKPIDQLPSKYLDIVHINIAFRDCVFIGGFKYALIFMNHTTRFNWTFGLKSLQHNNIQSAFLSFRDKAGSLARQFRCGCDEKLFGSAVRLFLNKNNSSIAASPAGQQSYNGLVKSHWKIMVHMSRAYLTKKQMPHTFWYFAI
jgi:hypothetical protein